MSFDPTRYKPVPENATELVLEPRGCDDDCHCCYVQVVAMQPSTPYPWPHGRGCTNHWAVLWESHWLNPYDFGDWARQEPVDLREEARAACAHYGIDANLDSDCHYDWEGTRNPARNRYSEPKP